MFGSMIGRAAVLERHLVRPIGFRPVQDGVVRLKRFTVLRPPASSDCTSGATTSRARRERLSSVNDFARALRSRGRHVRPRRAQACA